MGRHELTCEPTLLQCSSIALLQERFRQLQRVKKMREERELMRMLAEPDLSSPKPVLSSQHDPPPKWLFLHPDLVHHRSPPSMCTLTSFKFQPCDRSEFINHNISLSDSIRLRDDKPNNVYVQNSGREMDVDTSLHL
ncbi:hypothetical protein J5N97_010465 [Dioscorea zingiberensis]|uniref:Uncharacterized protein n=1 Tax=Dioscorea zingiberensis TaxID=325984 RepID=A0A9D5D1A2_9LILI|nr:hypothetical protein J5N97_010465 [Dioscorea zingiberensis]